jgi:hypothetical protein
MWITCRYIPKPASKASVISSKTKMDEEAAASNQYSVQISLPENTHNARFPLLRRLTGVVCVLCVIFCAPLTNYRRIIIQNNYDATLDLLKADVPI